MGSNGRRQHKAHTWRRRSTAVVELQLGDVLKLENAPLALGEVADLACEALGVGLLEDGGLLPLQEPFL